MSQPATFSIVAILHFYISLNSTCSPNITLHTQKKLDSFYHHIVIHLHQKLQRRCWPLDLKRIVNFFDIPSWPGHRSIWMQNIPTSSTSLSLNISCQHPQRETNDQATQLNSDISHWKFQKQKNYYFYILFLFLYFIYFYLFIFIYLFHLLLLYSFYLFVLYLFINLSILLLLYLLNLFILYLFIIITYYIYYIYLFFINLLILLHTVWSN